jgi:hypothetical protein
MKIRTLLSCGLLAVLVGVPGYAKKKKIPEAFTTITVTCKGDRGNCVSYMENGKIINLAGTPEEVVVDGEHMDICPATNVSPTSVFIYSSGSTTTGQGFTGAQSCVDPASGRVQMLVGSSTVGYTSFSEWMNAASLH